ncbi:MAG: uroporphyrinogen decarboxylase family protein [bacterium]
MTSRERILKTIRKEKVDRIPVSPWGLGRLAPNSDMAKELISKTDILMEASPGVDPFWGEYINQLEEVGEGLYRLQTPRGFFQWRIGKTEITQAMREFPFKSPDDAERFLSLPYKKPKPTGEHFYKMREWIGEEGLVLVGIPNGVCLPASFFSPEDFCLNWALHPSLIIKLTEVGTERVIAMVEDLCREGVDAFRIIGGEYVTQQLGPKGVEALLKPYDIPLVETIHRYGAVAYYHNHGKVRSFLSDLRDLGIDALDPLEAPPWGDVDLKEAQETIGKEVCLVGNLDDMEILNKMDEKMVKKIALERIKDLKPVGFILAGTASGIFGEKAARNFIALAEMMVN